MLKSKMKFVGGILFFMLIVSLLVFCNAKTRKVEVDKKLIGTVAVCPVTGDSFTINEQTPVVLYKDVEYYMCCPGCDTEFMKDPTKYVNDAKQTQSPGKTAQEIDYWTCSMHPTVHADKPGDCPICGMELIPVRKNAGTTIKVDEKTKMVLGIRSQPVMKMVLAKTLQVPGRVANDQDLYLAQQEYLSAYRLDDELAKSARLKLSLLGFSEQDMKELEMAGQPDESLVYPSKQRAWILADIYPSDLALVRPGQRATVTFGAYPDERFYGTIESLQPAVSAETNTAMARILIMHPGKEIQLGLYAGVEINVNIGEQLVIPLSSIISTGKRNVVYLDLSNGQYQAREITTGTEANDYVQIIAGLQPGDKVVTDGNFLLDSQATLTGGQALLYGSAGEVNSVKKDVPNVVDEETQQAHHHGY